MTRLRRPAVLLLLLAGAAGCSAGGWDPQARPPAEVVLPDTADPRDPYAYYFFGHERLEGAPGDAAEAFRRAALLDPTWGEPLIARRVALLLTDMPRFDLYVAGNRDVVKAPATARLDSLFLRALMLDPFPRLEGDATAARRLVRYRATEEIRRRRGMGGVGTQNRARMREDIERALRSAPPDIRGWMAYSEGRFRDAALYYRAALDEPEHAEDPLLWADLGRSYYHARRYREAEASMTRALELFAREDSVRLVRVYESKALYHHSIGIIRAATGNRSAAREAFAAALQEDLAFWPAHVQLGQLALAAKDTATALGELALARDIAPREPAIRLHGARLLAEVGHLEDAVVELGVLLDLAPHFARPHYELGLVLERAGKIREAARHYRLYLEKAAARDPATADARKRLASLPGTNASPG